MNIALIASSADEASQSSSVHIVKDILEASEHYIDIVVDDELLVQSLRENRPDLALIAGEDFSLGDGHIQELLEVLDIPYIGTSAKACRVVNSTTALSFVVNRSFETADERINATWSKQCALGTREVAALRKASAFTMLVDMLPGGYPLVVEPDRPCADGEPLLVDSDESLQSAIEQTVGKTDRVLVRPFVEGVGLTVCLLGQGWDAFVLPAVERGVLDDTHNPFVGKNSQKMCVAPVRLESLSSDQAEAQAIRAEIERAALDVYAASGMRDWGSVDMIWDGARAQIIRVNCVPSLVSDSPFDCACKAVGLTFAGIINRMVDL